MTILSLDHALGQLARKTDRLKHAHDRRGKIRAAVTASIDLLARGLWHVWRNRRYLTLVKLTNMAMVNIQCHFKTERVIGLPYRMKIEPTNICNTHCQLCPTGLEIKGRAKGMMDFKRYTHLVDQLKRYLYTLDLSMWGDPLIVPNIYRMIRYAHDRGIWTYLSSNLHAFKPDRGQVDALIDSGLDLMTCSLHGASQQTYETYQPGKNFQSIIDKIKAIQQAKQQKNSTTPAIQLNFVVTRYNQHEIEDFRRLAQSLDCQPIFSNPSLNLRLIDTDPNRVPLSVNGAVPEKSKRQLIEQWLPDDDQYVIEPYRLIRDGHGYQGGHYNGHKIMDCHWPWKDSVINWDGTVVTCCGVYKPGQEMGNVFDQPFHKIWNAPAYRLARRSFKRTVAPSDHQANPCRDCPGFMI